MDAEFVNEYISRLISHVHDVTSKNIMLETKLVIAEKMISALQTELQNTKKK